MTDLSQLQHPRFARMYVRIGAESEERGTAAHRDCALVGLAGRVIEVGAGNGLNFAHYPDTVTEVVAVEPENRLRALAEQAAAEAAVPVRVVAGHAGALPAEDSTFDATVTSLVLCSVADVPAALAEIRRVLKPGGHFVCTFVGGADDAGRVKRVRKWFAGSSGFGPAESDLRTSLTGAGDRLWAVWASRVPGL